MADRDAALGPGVTRRDLIAGGVAAGGAALLGPGCAAPPAAPADDWTGPGGVGDYAGANGNTARTVEAAHRIRDKIYDGFLPGVAEGQDDVDLVVVGSGFGGLGALHAFARRRPGGTCLVLDNQEVFGGYAKANQFDVDGHRIAGAQASMNFVLPETAADRIASYWPDLGLPERFDFVPPAGAGAAIRFQRSSSGVLYYGEQSASTGYCFAQPESGQPRWVNDIWQDDLARTPWSPALRDQFRVLRELKKRGRPQGEEARRLDAVTFADHAARELGVGPEAQRYVTLGMCQTGPQVSALAAMSLPGIGRFAQDTPEAKLGERFISFPDGNATLAKLFLKSVMPEAVAGGRDWRSVALGAIRPLALDRAGAPLRIRQGATVVRIEHEGDPARAERVRITYAYRGRLVRVRARGVVMTTGAWVAKHILPDLSTDRRAALDQFLYAPMLIVNVALRQWRFLDRLGISAARWFEGFGFYAAIRQPMRIADPAVPFGPGSPIVLTMYVPFPNPDLPLAAQGPAGRAALFGTSFADYEQQVVDQLTRLFGPAGFVAARDVAGIILNRWGHAFLTAGPGFYHGRDGAPPPSKIALAPWGRIGFGQSADWLGSARAGARAVEAILDRC